MRERYAKRMRQWVTVALFAGLMMPLQVARSQSIANWVTSTTGTLGSASFTISGGSWVSPEVYDISGANYAAAPLGPVNSGTFDVSSPSWTIAFDRPITDFRMYAVLWRGARYFTPSLNQQTDYGFSENLTILSGMTGVINITSTGFSTPAGTSSFYDGILAFADPITSLTVTIVGQRNIGGLQGVTFTGNTVAVPEPGSLELLAVAAVSVMVGVRRRRMAAAR